MVAFATECHSSRGLFVSLIYDCVIQVRGWVHVREGLMRWWFTHFKRFSCLNEVLCCWVSCVFVCICFLRQICRCNGLFYLSLEYTHILLFGWNDVLWHIWPCWYSASYLPQIDYLTCLVIFVLFDHIWTIWASPLLVHGYPYLGVFWVLCLVWEGIIHLNGYNWLICSYLTVQGYTAILWYLAIFHLMLSSKGVPFAWMILCSNRLL